jgi:hypothetical protein
MAYMKAGQPDGGWEVLFGNLLHDQFNYISPGMLGVHYFWSLHLLSFVEQSVKDVRLYVSLRGSPSTSIICTSSMLYLSLGL